MSLGRGIPLHFRSPPPSSLLFDGMRYATSITARTKTAPKAKLANSHIMAHTICYNFHSTQPSLLPDFRRRSFTAILLLGGRICKIRTTTTTPSPSPNTRHTRVSRPLQTKYSNKIRHKFNICHICDQRLFKPRCKFRSNTRTEAHIQNSTVAST